MLFSHMDEDCQPERLVTQCLNCICKNMNIVFNKTDRGYVFKKEISLPDQLSQLLIHTYQKNGGIIDDKFANIFANCKKTRLTKAHIWNADITHIGFHSFVRRRLEELTIAYCRNINFKIFDIINPYGENLRQLKLEYGIPYLKYSRENYRNSSLDFYYQRGYVAKLPALEHLTLKGCHVPPDSRFFDSLLRVLSNLQYLDLSSCQGIVDFSFLFELKQLKTLILFDVPNVEDAISTICQIKTLKYLDISQSTISPSSVYQNENNVLAMIIENLPELVCLDISGTNLAGTGAVQPHLFNKYEDYHSDIPGLISRSKKPLEFLGLYGTPHGACRRYEIPAKHIAGEFREEQLLIAGRVYMYRPAMILKVLGDMFHLLRDKTHTNTYAIVKIIMESIIIHNQDKNIQISGSAAMFSLFKSKDSAPCNAYIRREIIKAILHSMMTHSHDDIIVRNGCLTLCQLNIPQDFLFIYHDLVRFLLDVITNGKMEGFIQRITMYLLNSLACQVDDSQKLILGDLKVIERMLNLIRGRISFGLCDDVLEIAWSTMWNVTDETPINCKRFLDDDGMMCFRSCLQIFHEKNELMRNMMGLLGNVAEVEELRPRLLSYVSIFYKLLNSDRGGIEISYNAAGVLAHLASDGVDAWKGANIDRKLVLNRMTFCIDCWNITTERNINYRSFKPILRLASCEHTPACQHWACWALANLTTVYFDKYCAVVKREGGLEILHRIVNNDKTPAKIKKLASIVMENCNRFEKLEQQSTDRNISIIEAIVMPA